MSAQCIGGSARKLVDERFVRLLDGDERGHLEAHLVACAACSERYRRLQLAERVAAVGPERAVDEPGSFEIERIAGDLGLLESPRRLRIEWLPIGGLFLAAATAALAFLLLPVVASQDEGELLPRGAPVADTTFAVYVVSAAGEVRAHRAEEPVRAGEHLKLRVSRAATEGTWPQLSAIVAGTEPRVLRLESPRSADPSASVPGAIAAGALPRGRAALYLIAAPELPEDARLIDAVEGEPAAELVAKKLEARVQRVELVVE